MSLVFRTGGCWLVPEGVKELAVFRKGYVVAKSGKNGCRIPEGMRVTRFKGSAVEGTCPLNLQQGWGLSALALILKTSLSPVDELRATNSYSGNRNHGSLRCCIIQRF